MKTVLICDDAAFMRTILKNLITLNGYHVIGEAVNGMDACEMYRRLKPDLVTMDITMPVMDGIEAVKEIIAEFPDANIIMCSAMGQQILVMEAIQAGAKDFIVKPFQPEKVIGAINKIFFNI